MLLLNRVIDYLMVASDRNRERLKEAIEAASQAIEAWNADVDRRLSATKNPE